MLEGFFERTANYYIPIQGHVRDDVLHLDDGSVYAMLSLTPQPWETAEEARLQDLKRRINHSYMQIAADTITLTFYDCRGEAPRSICPQNKFDTDFVRSLDAELREALFAKGLWQNEIFCGVRVSPQRYLGETIGEHVARHTKRAEEPNEARIGRLDEIIAQLRSEWKEYRPIRLGVRVEGRRAFSEIGEALLYAWTGVRRKVGLTNGRMGEALFSEHPVFDGDVIKFLFPGRVQYAAAFGMKHFPAWTWPGMFGPLLTAPYRCTTCQSYRFIGTPTAQGIMTKKRARMLLADDPADEQATDLKKAANNLASADYVFGDYSFAHFVFARSEEELNDAATSAWTVLANSGMIVAREHLGLEAAFASMMPGNNYYAPRPGYVASVNMASMVPFHGYHIGAERSRWGGPILMARSPTSGTPIRVHLHAGTGAESAANVLITGANGSGKTVLAAALIAFASSRARIFALDHKRGWQMLFRAMLSDYMVMGSGQPNFAPCKALDNTARNREFIIDAIRGCVLSDGNPRGFTPEDDRRLSLGVETVMDDDVPRRDRSIGAVRELLGSDPNGIGARLDKWCWGGELGWVLDAPTDEISLTGRRHGFDLTALLTNKRARGPALLYLLHRIELELDGNPILIPIDEGWSAVLDPVFAPLIDRGFRTIRSKNGGFVFISQSPGDIVHSEIGRTLVEQSQTQFHLANPYLSEEDFVGGMKRSKAEYKVLRSLPKGQGQFLLCQDGIESQVGHLPMHGMDKFLPILSGSEDDIRTFDRVEMEMRAVFQKFHEERLREAAE